MSPTEVRDLYNQFNTLSLGKPQEKINFMADKAANTQSSNLYAKLQKIYTNRKKKKVATYMVVNVALQRIFNSMHLPVLICSLAS